MEANVGLRNHSHLSLIKHSRVRSILEKHRRIARAPALHRNPFERTKVSDSTLISPESTIRPCQAILVAEHAKPTQPAQAHRPRKCRHTPRPVVRRTEPHQVTALPNPPRPLLPRLPTRTRHLRSPMATASLPRERMIGQTSLFQLRQQLSQLRLRVNSRPLPASTKQIESRKGRE